MHQYNDYLQNKTPDIKFITLRLANKSLGLSFAYSNYIKTNHLRDLYVRAYNFFFLSKQADGNGGLIMC